MNTHSSLITTNTEPMTSVLWVKNIIEALNACGLDGDGLALNAGIKPDHLAQVTSGIAVKKIVRLWELAVDASGNEAIGLHAAQNFRPSAVGVLGYAMMSSPSLLEAMQRGVRYSGSLTSATTASLSQTSEGYRFTFHIMTGIVGIQRQNHDFIMLGFLKFFRWIAGQDLQPIRVELMHAKPPEFPLYQELFNCPLAFGCDQTALVFTGMDIGRPLLTSNPLLVEIHDLSAERQLSQLGRAETTHRVRQLIVQALPDGEPSRDDIAACMNISSRSLQRRLQEENQSFHAILEAVRRNLAEHYLGKDQISLANVGDLLGFSDQSSFTRAARRWFGASPSKVRVELLAQHENN